MAICLIYLSEVDDLDHGRSDLPFQGIDDLDHDLSDLSVRDRCI